MKLYLSHFHKSVLVVVEPSMFPNLGNTEVRTFRKSFSTLLRSTYPWVRRIIAITKIMTNTKVTIINNPALLVAYLIISASVFPDFLLSSKY